MCAQLLELLGRAVDRDGAAGPGDDVEVEMEGGRGGEEREWLISALIAAAILGVVLALAAGGQGCAAAPEIVLPAVAWQARPGACGVEYALDLRGGAVALGGSGYELAGQGELVLRQAGCAAASEAQGAPPVEAGQ